MDFWGKRVGNSLVPDGDESVVAFSKVPFEKLVRIEVLQPRSAKRHRLYWAICRRIADGIGTDAENIDEALKLSTGYYEQFHTRTLGIVRRTKSISFQALDDIGFAEFMRKALDTIFLEWGIPAETFKDITDGVK